MPIGNFAGHAGSGAVSNLAINGDIYMKKHQPILSQVILALTLISLALFLAGCGSSGSKLPAITGSTGVAYMSHTSSTGTDYQIKLMKTDGTSVTSVGSPDLYNSAHLSPDGTKILYAILKTGVANQIGIMDVDGSNAKLLLTSGDNEVPQFSADGTRVIYQTWGQANDRFDIGLMNVDGTDNTTIDFPLYTSFNPTLSPDGKTIAFGVNLPSPAVGQGLATCNADGTGFKLIVSVSGYYVSQPMYTTDGTKILFSYYNPTTNSGNINSINPDGSGQIVALTISNYEATPEAVGSKILFMSGRSVANPTWDNYQIYSMNPDGSDQTQLTHDTLADTFFAEVE
jgi:Tol biopolymer transport system component